MPGRRKRKGRSIRLLMDIIGEDYYRRLKFEAERKKKSISQLLREFITEQLEIHHTLHR